jgi:hypothetical protein
VTLGLAQRQGELLDATLPCRVWRHGVRAATRAWSVRFPAFGDQRRSLVGAGEPDGGQVRVQPGGVGDVEPVQGCKQQLAADLFGDRANASSARPEPVVV